MKYCITTLIITTLTIGGSMLYDDLSSKLEVSQKKLENEYKINAELLNTNRQLKTELEEQSNIIETQNEIYDNLKKEYEQLQKHSSSLEKQIESLKQKQNHSPLGEQKITMTLTFYGDFAHENGGHQGIDAQGNKLIAGTVASNVYPMGTQFEYNGKIFTVRDRGGSNFNNYNRLDVFVPRNNGESDTEYANRISHYGKKTVVMYKLEK